MIPPPMNPFRPTRWEHHRDGYQLIWFTRTAEQLCLDKSIYVRGSRGSGKTTLLRSICWEDLSNNISLKMQRDVADFAHIGLYVRFPDHLSASIVPEMWSRAYPDADHPEMEFHRFFSLLVECACLERALEACHELRIKQHLEFAPSQELRIVESIVSEFPKLADFSPNIIRTFTELARCLRQVSRRMNEGSGRGALVDIVSALPSRQPGELLAFAAQRLSESVRLVTKRGLIEPSFKFCLDDCEALNAHQQRSINTLVRVSKHPVSWVISAVGVLFDSTNTFVDQQPLTDADRRVIILDERADVDFRELCQAVVSLRLMFSVSEKFRTSHSGKEISDFFPLEDKFPRRDVNDLMAALLQRSSNPLAKKLSKAAQNLRAALRHVSKRQRAKFPAQSKKLPLYEAYVLMLWRGRGEAFKTKFEDADETRIAEYAPLFDSPNFEAWLRRKQRAALMHFASSFKIRRLPLSGVGIIVSLADGSIRDFLEIVGDIYEGFAKRNHLEPSSIECFERFASRSAVATDIQTDGIYAASAGYYRGVSATAERDVGIAARLLEGLGLYTSILQSNPDDPTVLGSAERGRFVVRFKAREPSYVGDEAPARERAVWAALRQAEIDGYIRTTDVRFADGASAAQGDHGRVMAFRLHRRFAPHFRFSYRGAYEPVSLGVDDLWALCDRRAGTTGREWAEGMSRRSPDVDGNQLPLPLTEGDRDE